MSGIGSTCVAALMLASVVSAATAQNQHAGPFVPAGLFLGRVEEGARIFTPVRLLPMDHPEALGHQFPTVQQLHGTEFPMLLWLGEQAGLRLRATLQRYPTQPDSIWPYQGFRQPPGEAALRDAQVVHRPGQESPLTGLRAVLYADRATVAFLVDTRSLTLEMRGMKIPTAMGLDISRAEFLQAMDSAAHNAPAHGIAAVVFDP